MKSTQYKDFVCEHRHHVNTCTCAGDHCSHVNCWVESRYSGGRIGYLDIEVSQLKGDFGFVISWVLKERGKDKVWSAHIKTEDIKESLKKGRVLIDKRILQELEPLLPQFDFIVCHYGAIDRGLDIRFLRTRFLKYGLRFPPYRSMFALDTYLMAKYKLVLHSNRLDVIAQFLGCPVEKTEIDPDNWILAEYGDEKSLKYVVEHNTKDVFILEYVHKKLEAFANVGKRSI